MGTASAGAEASAFPARRFFGGPLGRMQQHRLSMFRTLCLRHDFDRTVIVTVIAVGMVQVAIDEIIDMLVVRHRLVPTTGAVSVTNLVTAAIMVRRAPVGVVRADFYNVLFDQRGSRGPNWMVQVAIDEIIDMVDVFDDGMAAVWAMLVTVVGMGVGSAHKTCRLANGKHRRSEAKTQHSVQIN
jgi:hypothetical protein